jgi:hypothetical protein
MGFQRDPARISTAEQFSRTRRLGRFPNIFPKNIHAAAPRTLRASSSYAIFVAYR